MSQQQKLVRLYLAFTNASPLDRVKVLAGIAHLLLHGEGTPRASWET